ncbi:MAG: hypothetical protein RLZZ127_924 [Planctomycetota bacterium]|jgi:hypothetical protein
MPHYLIALNWSPAQANRYATMSPAEMQATIAKYNAWSGAIAQAGKLRGGEKLRDTGWRVMTASGVTDGPFSESKEFIGGFFIIEASDYDEAVKLCRKHPHLEFGSVEIREIEPIHGR